MPKCEFCGQDIRAGDVHTRGESNCCTLEFEDGTIWQFYHAITLWYDVTNKKGWPLADGELVRA